MKDYAQYSSRIPSPSVRRSPGTPKTTATTTKNVKTHPLNSVSTPSPDKRERETSSASNSSTSSTGAAQRQQAPQHASPLNPSDALSLRREGSEATIQKLRQALDDATGQDSTAKAALAKSDAVILELRSSIRQLKRQTENHNPKVQELNKHIQQLQQRLTISQSSSNDPKVGELQIQLDRAHAQILTADMVRKELEDTLEAEQYTWELRVQDQERTIILLQQECDTLAQDLEACRGQWKEAEQGWSSQLEDLQQQLTQARTRIATSQALNKSNNNEELMQKVRSLEKERAELQNCLDEALQELEAVDAELQTENGGSKKGQADPNVLESLQHLLRWILQEGKPNGESESPDLHNLSKDPKELFERIQEALEQWISQIDGDQKSTSVGDVSDLQKQLSVYQDELKSREESSAELRESLKEAVALLKPLQDAVARVEEEKKNLRHELQDVEEKRKSERAEAQQQLMHRKHQIQSLEDQVVSLKEQVEENKQLASARQSLLEATTSPAATPNSKGHEDSVSRIQRARDELRRKRETEGNLQKLLKDAQTRFHSLHQQNEDVAARNRELQGQLKHAERQLGGDAEATLEEQLEQCVHELLQKEKHIESLQKELEERSSRQTQPDAAQERRIHELHNELSKVRSELAQKEQAERILNKSLKDALGLLKPLQMHLEDAEREKMEISKELRNLRKRFRQLQMGDSTDDQSRSTLGGGDVSFELIKIKEELEETVRHLELENSQLHDALEDMSGEDNSRSDAKVHQQMVELNSRYEVTQNKLEDAHVENHALIKALKQKELEERQRANESRIMREKLQKAESELNNAKAIARSALVKVEELTMANVEQLSLSRDGSLTDQNFNVNIETLSR